MISEIITGVFAAATGGYLWARARHQKRAEMSRDRIKTVAGITPDSQTKNNNEPYWWQKGEHQKMIMSRGKLPEKQEELEKYLEAQKQELKNDSHMFYYSEEEKRKQEEQQQEQFKRNMNDLQSLLSKKEKF